MSEHLADELEQTQKELQEALDTIDDIINTISEVIINISEDNDDFICTCCLETASELYQLLKNYAREEDCGRICEQWACNTGRNLDDE